VLQGWCKRHRLVRDRDSENPPLELVGYEPGTLHRGVTDGLLQKPRAEAMFARTPRLLRVRPCGIALI
jgi:hypothetical protein